MSRVGSRWGRRLLVAGVLLLSATRGAPAQSKDAQLREQVLESIRRAQQFLIKDQMSDGRWESSQTGRYPTGATALAVLALLNSDLPADHPTVARGLKYLREARVPGQTYELAMIIMALAAAGDRQDAGRIALLSEALAGIQRAGGGQDGRGGGAWGYSGSDLGWWDNSNSQIALLAMREAAYAGVPVDDRVWRSAQQHWMQTSGAALQRNPLQANGWTYNDLQRMTGSMTAAGVASLTITWMMLRDLSGETADGDIDCCGADAKDDAVRAVIDGGMRWLSQHFTVLENPGEPARWALYYLYGLERAGRMTGTRFFGDHDWYREGARHLVENQDLRTGSWVSTGEQDPVLGGSFGLLFLSKGLSPVLINKLKFGPRHADTHEADAGFWNAHPRDISNLTDYISGRPHWPRLVTWQVLDLPLAAQEEGVSALLQAPIQYIGGRENPNLMSEAEVSLLREYLAQGGFLFAVQGCQSADFEDGFRALVGRLFPDGDFQLARLPDTHDVYRSENVFEANPPELWGVDVGCRTAIIYAPYDHACRWDRWMRHDPPGRHAQVKTQITKSMQIGVNVVAYATGRDLADKLRTPEVIGADADDPLNRGRTTIARLRHTGGFDTAPHALKHLRLALESIDIDISPLTPTIAATDPTLPDYPLVYMHGRKNFALSNPEREKLAAYLGNGGFLFVDACCGAPQFDASFRRLIEQMFGRPLERIPVEHELFQNPLGHDIRSVKRRIPTADAARAALTLQESTGAPVLEGIEVDGRYVVVYSKYDLSCALERQVTFSCAGYPREEAVKIGVNIVLYGLYQ